MGFKIMPYPYASYTPFIPEPHITVGDLLAVFPELELPDTTPEEFADKVKQAADLVRREDAYIELRDSFDTARTNHSVIAFDGSDLKDFIAKLKGDKDNEEETMEENEGE